MILVLCGTQKQDFSRLINEVAILADDYDIIVQGGHNNYQSDKMTLLNFISPKKLQQLYEQAEVVITHAGAGSMIQSLKNQKKTLAVPRLSKYGEHVNDHQLELSKKLEELGYLLVYNDGDNFKDIFEKIKHFTPKPYELKGQILSLIDNELEKIFYNTASKVNE